MTASHTRIPRLVVLVALSALLAVGCGDDTSADPDGRSPQPGVETTEAGPPPDEGLVFADLPHACDLVTPDEVEALIGPADQEGIEDRAIDGARYTQCFWDGHDGITMIGVSVVDTPRRHALHRQTLPTFDELHGLGDEALAAPGVSSETRGATGGRTVSVRIDEITLMVALRYEDVTPVEDVRPLAESVVERLG